MKNNLIRAMLHPAGKNKSLHVFYLVIWAISFFSTALYAIEEEKPCTLPATVNEPAQKKVVSGKVTDAAGLPLPGVSVQVKGKLIGTTTDADARYALSGIPENATLVFSFVGMKTEEIPVGNKTVINVVLREETILLDEVVAVGYGTRKKKDLTGAVISVKKATVENEKPKRITDFLRGNVPGLEVGFDVSAKGGGEIEMRGHNTLKASSNPLIVLDGIIYNGDLSNINPNDIETIDILKDASSAAIYGARSANGVILVTTKSGTNDSKPVLNFTAGYSVETIAHMAKVRDHNQFLTWRQDVMKSMNYYNESQKDKLYLYDHPDHLPQGVTLEMWRDGNQNDPLDIYLSRLGLGAIESGNYKAGKYIDWADYCFQTGNRQDYNVSVSGKANRIKYYGSLGYEDNKGNVIGDRYNAIRSLLKLETDITPWLTIGVNTSFSSRNEGYVPVDINQYRTNSPYGSRYQDDGITLRYSTTDDPVSSVAPDYDRNFIDRRSVIRTWTNNLFAKLKLPFGFAYELNYAPRFEYTEYMNHQSAFHQEWGKKGGLAERTNSSLAAWEMNHILRWNKNFNNLHQFEVTLLANAEQRKYWWDKMTTEGFSPSDVLGYHKMDAGSSLSNIISSNDEHSTGNAFMARLFYSLRNRYMLTLSLRRDGYSAFGMNNPYGVFPSAALGWIFSEESIFKNDILTYGKLRFSWGENGNRSIGIYDALSNMSTGKYPYQSLNGSAYESSLLWVSRMANYDLKWERTRSFNIGLDFGIKEDLLSGSLEVYKSSTLDLLVDRKMTNVSGFTSTVANMGQIDNVGVELNLNARIMEIENFRWDGSFTFYTNKNKIVHLYGNMTDVTDEEGNVIGQREADDLNNKWFIGHPVDEIWNYRVLGVWQQDEAEEAKKYGQFPGDFHLLDKNKDGKYNDDDKEFLGRSKPKFNWSMRHNFTIRKNLEVSFMLYSQWGHFTSYNAAKNSDGFVERQNSYQTPYWTPENPINDYSRIRSQTGGIDFNVYRERSFIRLDNISVGYKFPQTLIRHVGMTDLKVTGSIRNVFCWAPHWPDNYWDPETLTRSPRSFSIGLSLTL
ncbi:SusC/RagA family TonB-linked outer membrane protein [Parabacteroides pacaensis]|uniref:SusC/RagA family TonB-linked outer membrane protein n=1 Tax=Parabacteroides pacaensis TaxID=2086575 RepID=UPI000D0E6A5C|nr:SusC/RagA family TonB-linked outer membrane protein [Parabacteroides pacaensis]